MPRSATTRDDLLRSARQLLETEPFSEVSLGKVAAQAGVSRQAVYLHFASKTDLLLALVQWVDDQAQMGERFAQASTHEDPVERLAVVVRAGAAYLTEIADTALALRAARDADPAARSAWDDRAKSRWAGMRAGVQAVADAGRLNPGLTVRTATDAVYALMSFTMYEDLVRERGWSQKRYETFVADLVRHTVVADD